MLISDANVNWTRVGEVPTKVGVMTWDHFAWNARVEEEH